MIKLEIMLWNVESIREILGLTNDHLFSTLVNFTKFNFFEIIELIMPLEFLKSSLKKNF